MKTSLLFSLLLSLSACGGQATHYIGDLTKTFRTPGKTDLVVHESGKGVTVFTGGNDVMVDGLSYGSIVFNKATAPNAWVLEPLFGDYEQGQDKTESGAKVSPDYLYEIQFEQGTAEIHAGYAQMSLSGTITEEENDVTTESTRMTVEFSGLSF